MNFKTSKKLQIGQTGSLADLKPLQSAIVTSVDATNPALRRRLFDMGLTKGAVVKIKKVAPFGDPIDIEIRGYELCLRREDVKEVKVEVTA